MDALFSTWLDALFARHLAHLTFREVRRGLQALSTRYVSQRCDVSVRALEGAGKRAAFALVYGPQHFLLTREIVGALGAAKPALRELFDLGCGCGVAGAAWALASISPPSLTAVEQNRWAQQEARWTLCQLGLKGTVKHGDLLHLSLPTRPHAGIVAAYVVNELPPDGRQRLRERLLAAAGRGARVLVIEPIAKRSLSWWDDWCSVFVDAGGRADTWAFDLTLPPRLRELQRAAGLRQRQLKARSLYLRPGS